MGTPHRFLVAMGELELFLHWMDNLVSEAVGQYRVDGCTRGKLVKYGRLLDCGVYCRKCGSRHAGAERRPVIRCRIEFSSHSFTSEQ